MQDHVNEKHYIEILQAWMAGKTIQTRDGTGGEWQDCPTLYSPHWNFHTTVYRIKPRSPVVAYAVVAKDSGHIHGLFLTCEAAVKRTRENALKLSMVTLMETGHE